MKYKNTLNQIKALLSMEVKLAQMKLEDGVTVVEAEAFEPEYSVGIVTQDGIVPMPVGEYTLEDGRILKVEVEGIIASVEAPEQEVEVEVEAPAAVTEPAMEAAPAPKRVVESVSKETFFESLKAENESLKAEIESIKAELSKQVELASDEEEAAEPIAHNPEAEKVEAFKFGTKRQLTTQDRVYSKLFN